jgi:iron-sulfur cluster assembly protein
VLEFVDDQDPSDSVFEVDGVRVFVDPKSLVYLDGTIVDFAREGLNEGLEFRNPNVAGECGCGESFTV